MRMFLFCLLSALALLSAFAVVTVRSLFRSSIGLIAMLLGVAGLYLLLDAQFLSAVQITVYVGGIVVLIVYVVLLVADVSQKSYPPRKQWRQVVAGALSAALFVLLAVALLSLDLRPAEGTPVQSASVAQIGRALLSPERGGYVLPFEVISLLLVAAMIGAITIARGSGEEKS